MQGGYKANVDASIKNGADGVGIMVRDYLGEVIAAVAFHSNGLVNSGRAEVLALTKGIKLVNDLFLPSFPIETDCLSWVSAIDANGIDD